MSQYQNKFSIANILCVFLLFSFSSLINAASISGQITDSNGKAISEHYVSLYTWDGKSLMNYGDFSTDENGKYQITELTNGEYYLEFTDWSGAYIEQAYATDMPLDINCINYHTPINILAETNLTNIDAKLNLGGTISGRVTDPHGKGIADVYVYAHTWDGTAFFQQSSIPLTDADGNYNVVGLASGDYYLHFDKPDSPYLSQSYLNEIPFKWGSIENKAPITVQAGQNINNIDMQLSLAGSISGRVTDSSGKGISGVYAYAYTWDGTAFIAQASIPLTDKNGYYTIPGLVSADYFLHFVKDNDDQYISQGYINEIPFKWGNIDFKTAIRIDSGQNFTDINIQLTNASSISGRVTDTNGKGISGVYAYAYTWDGTAFIAQASIPLTDENGYYTIPGLVSADYFLHFVKPDSIYSSLGYANETPFKWGDIEDKTGIRIITGQQVTNLDIQLSLGENSSNPSATPIPVITPVPTQAPTATINSIVGNLISVTPDKVQLNKAGDTPEVQNVLVMLTEEQSGVTFERVSKTKIILQEKTVAIFHPPSENESAENEPVTLIRGIIESNVNCNDYELRTALAKVVSTSSCSCFSNSSLRKRASNTHTQFTTNYQQNDLDASLTVSVKSGVVEITDRNNVTTTLSSGEETLIQNIIPRTSWVLPIDGYKIYAGKSNLFVWTAFPEAAGYILEYNLPTPVFSEDNSAKIEFSNQAMTLRPGDYTEYEDLVLFNLLIGKSASKLIAEGRIFAIDATGNIISDSISSDKVSVNLE